MEDVLIVIEHLFQSIEVEAISDVLFIYLAKELMILEVAEPAYPSITLL